MPKPYKDRSMKVIDEAGPVDWDKINEYFFPKHNPPVTIKAASLEEAEAKLAELDNAK